MHAIDLADSVIVRRAEDSNPRPAIRCWADDAPRPTPIDWPEEADLACRAHTLMEDRTGRRLHASLRILKRIPVGGGLGGGSSDAAATMLALNDLFDLRVDLPTLAAWSAALGSDIAFFLDSQNPPRPAFVSGFGDRVERTPRAAADLTLILPDFGCATPAVYRAFDTLARHVAPADSTAVLAAARDARVAAGVLVSDLAPAACSVEPRLQSVITRAETALGTPIHMSGSGSTLFALASAPVPRPMAKVDRCVLIPARLI